MKQKLLFLLALTVITLSANAYELPKRLAPQAKPQSSKELKRAILTSVVKTSDVLMDKQVTQPKALAAPKTIFGAVAVVDDIEKHLSSTINSVGLLGWTAKDYDKLPTYGFQGVSIPNLGEQMAYMALNWDYYFEPGTAHSGETTLFFPAAIPSASVKSNNDWIISPALQFNAPFTFSFFGRAQSSTYTEKFRVGYSTTDMEQASFTWIKTESTKALTWAEYSYTVPANAKYVAINYISEDAFGLLVDDLKLAGDGSELVEAAPLALKLTIKSSTGDLLAGAIAMINGVLLSAPSDSKGDIIVEDLAPGVYSALISASAHEIAEGLIEVSKDKNAYAITLKKIEMKDEMNLTWSNYVSGEFPNAMSLTGEALINACAMFSKQDLLPYIGYQVMGMYVGIKDACDIVPYLYPNEVTEEPYAVEIPADKVKANELNWVDFEAANLFIDETSSFQLGYLAMNYAAGKTPAAVDHGPAIAGKGDGIVLDNKLYSLAMMGFNFNWVIGLNIYKQGAAVEQVTLTAAPIFAIDNSIHMIAQGGETIHIFDVTGKKVVEATAVQGVNQFQLPTSQLYIVKLGEQTAKVRL